MKIAIVTNHAQRFKQYVGSKCDAISGDKTITALSNYVSIEVGETLAEYYLVSSIEHARGIIFDAYKLLDVEDIIQQLERRGAKRI